MNPCTEKREKVYGRTSFGPYHRRPSTWLQYDFKTSPKNENSEIPVAGCKSLAQENTLKRKCVREKNVKTNTVEMKLKVQIWVQSSHWQK